MKNFYIIFLTLIAASVSAQRNARKEVVIPSIPGYEILKCDFHIHTVFSDGNVWPTTRVEEAWLDGLDVISITDHVEYTPHKNDIPVNYNRPYEIAKGKANELNIILIKGAEVTRSYPLGHNNCLFLEDAELLNKANPMDAFTEAAKQNAVFQWNHPGWKMPNRIPVWSAEQRNMLNKKMLHMIEIVNGVDENSYYPLAHQWALDHNLAISANSDVHDPIYMNYGAKFHRPMTLVFAKERTAKGVKEALLAGRTAVYHLDTLIGKEELLSPVFNASLRVTTPRVTLAGLQRTSVILENTSDIPLMVSFKGGSDEYLELGTGIFIPARHSVKVSIKGLKNDFSGVRQYKVDCIIDNFWTAPNKKLNASFLFSVEFLKNK